MSDSTYTTSSSTAKPAQQTSEHGVYSKESKEGVAPLGSTTSTHAQGAAHPVGTQAQGALNTAASTTSAYASAANDKVNEHAPPSNAASAPTMVEKAQGAAALTTETAAQLAASAAATAQSYVVAAQEKLSGAASQTSTAADQFQKDASAHTNAAAREGANDVHAQGAAASYVDQAKTLAGAALGTAHTYVGLGKDKLDTYVSNNPPNPDTTLGSITSTLHSATSTALGTTTQYLASAQTQLQPQAEGVKHDLETGDASTTGHPQGTKAHAQPYGDAAHATGQQHLASAPSVTSTGYAHDAKLPVQSSVGSAISGQQHLPSAPSATSASYVHDTKPSSVGSAISGQQHLPSAPSATSTGYDAKVQVQPPVGAAVPSGQEHLATAQAPIQSQLDPTKAAYKPSEPKTVI